MEKSAIVWVPHDEAGEVHSAQVKSTHVLETLATYGVQTLLFGHEEDPVENLGGAPVFGVALCPPSEVCCCGVGWGF